MRYNLNITKFTKWLAWSRPPTWVAGTSLINLAPPLRLLPPQTASSLTQCPRQVPLKGTGLRSRPGSRAPLGKAAAVTLSWFLRHLHLVFLSAVLATPYPVWPSTASKIHVWSYHPLLKILQCPQSSELKPVPFLGFHNIRLPALLMFSSVQSLSCVQLFAVPWTAASQASLFITNSWSLLRVISIELVMPSNHLILRHPLLLLPSIFPSIRVFSNDPEDLAMQWIWVVPAPVPSIPA